MAREVDQIGQAPADQRVDLFAVDLARPDGVAVVAFSTGRQASVGRDQQVVVGEHALDRVVDLGAGRLVAEEIERRHAGSPASIQRRYSGGKSSRWSLSRSRPFALKISKVCDVERHDQPAPEIAQLALRPLDADLDLLDHGHPPPRRRGPPWRPTAATRRLDREDVEVRAVGDLPAVDRGPGRGREVDLLVQAEGIARVVAGERGERERRVFDRAGDRPLEHERRGAAEGVGPAKNGTRPNEAL